MPWPIERELFFLFFLRRVVNSQLEARMTFFRMLMVLFIIVDSLWSNNSCRFVSWLLAQADDFVLHFNGQIAFEFTCFWHLVFTVFLFDSFYDEISWIEIRAWSESIDEI